MKMKSGLIEKQFRKLGFKCLPKQHINANGPDLVIIKGPKSYTVEIKNIKVTERGSLQVPPVSIPRKGDDLIAIVISKDYVLIEPMKDHLKLCTGKGYRTMPVCLSQCNTK